MKVSQAVRLVPPEGQEGEIIVTMPMDVELFAKFIGPLGKAGWRLVGRNRSEVPSELAYTPDLFLDIAQEALNALETDGAHHKQHALATILEACGVEVPEHLDRGIPA